jgi:hypothetical protein
MALYNPMMRHEFALWTLHQQAITSLSKWQEAILLEADWVDDNIWTPGQSVYRGQQVIACPSNYSAFKSHTHAIQSFATQSPENWAQVVLFAPLTANSTFSMVVEGLEWDYQGCNGSCSVGE